MAKNNHEKWMKLALAEANLAQLNGDVPVGCVLVKNDSLVAKGHNKTILLTDPIAHAEIVAIKAAAKQLNNYRLTGTTMYVTLEPCAMCTGAIIHSRIEKVIIATPDPKTGCVVSNFKLFESFNHKPSVTIGYCQDEASALLKNFFYDKRNSN